VNTQRWALVGPAAALVYTAAVLVGGAITPGYSHTRDHISTLLQAGSDNGPVLIPPFLLYNGLTMVMGITLVAIARNATRPRTRLGILAGIALVAGGMSGAAILVFPQDPIGAAATSTGVTHIALAGVSSLLTMVAIGLAGAWFIATPERRPLAWYSFATLGVVFVGGGIAAIATANLDPWMGLYERIAIFGFVGWLLVVGLVEAGRAQTIARDEPRYA
jgi:Protein of unknown function (DUF998)